MNNFRKITVKAQIEYEITIPRSWDKEHIEENFNTSGGLNQLMNDIYKTRGRSVKKFRVDCALGLGIYDKRLNEASKLKSKELALIILKYFSLRNEAHPILASVNAASRDHSISDYQRTLMEEFYAKTNGIHKNQEMIRSFLPGQLELLA